MRTNKHLSDYDLDRLSRAITYLEKNYQDAISAEQLSLEVYMDVKKLQKGIQQLTGLTIHNLLLSIRVSKAVDDLQNLSRPIKLIACKHGFCSSSHFGTEFKKRMGMTPRSYRSHLLLMEYSQAS